MWVAKPLLPAGGSACAVPGGGSGPGRSGGSDAGSGDASVARCCGSGRWSSCSGRTASGGEEIQNYQDSLQGSQEAPGPGSLPAGPGGVSAGSGGLPAGDLLPGSGGLPTGLHSAPVLPDSQLPLVGGCEDRPAFKADRVVRLPTRNTEKTAVVEPWRSFFDCLATAIAAWAMGCGGAIGNAGIGRGADCGNGVGSAHHLGRPCFVVFRR